MGLIDRFLGKRKASGASPVVASKSQDGSISLQLLFPGELRLDPGALERSLRAYHPSMSGASCEIDVKLADTGAAIGLLGWGTHVVRLVGINAPMPAAVVEKFVAGAHYDADLKAQARAHRSHVILYYAGQEDSPLERYIALACVSGVLAKHGAFIVANESGHTSIPAKALAVLDAKGDAVALLRSFPIPILCSGMVKLEVEGRRGVWMRTFGDHLLGLPDLAHLAESHDDGPDVMDMFDDLLRYLTSSKKPLAPGHTMEIGPTTFLKVRRPREDEDFLQSEGTMLVLEKISKDEINRRGT